MRLILVLLAALATPLAAQETRSIIDDTGVEVTFPARPTRIASLHDSQLTIPLLELGVIPAGSHGRVPDGDGAPFIRSGMILAGTDFGNAPIEWLGDRPIDLERVAALKPDLILVTEWSDVSVDRLREIAPTIVVDLTKRSREQIYEVLAQIAGPEAQERLDRLEARYAAQIARFKAILPDAGKISVATFQVYDGTIYASHEYGNLGKVLRDVGFAMPAIVDAIPQNADVEFSLESLPEFDADVIIGTYNTVWGVELQSEREAILTSVPGFCDLMFACREGQIFLMPRDDAASLSWDALGMTATTLVTLLAGQDIKTKGQ